jgi:uncharacterized protein
VPTRTVAALACVAAALACGWATQPVAVVTDAAGLLDAAQQRAIALQHDVLLRDHDIDYRVDIVVMHVGAPDAASEAADLLAYGVRRYTELGVGSRSQSARGLLLVLDPTRDRVRLEVGQNLEGVYTDAFVAYLEERQMVPFFRAGRVADGILATTELVVTRAQQARAHAAFTPPALSEPDEAAGGGAETRAALGEGPDSTFRSGPDVPAGASPQATVEAYLAAMRDRNGNAGLDLYSAKTRELMKNRVMTPAQMDAVARAYRSCRADPPRVGDAGRRAVVRYPPDARACAPWFLLVEDGRWRLDLATASRVVRFGAGNAWHFAAGAAHPYQFAFDDWRFDRHGFPHAPPTARP